VGSGEWRVERKSMSRVLLRTVESGAWRVMRKIETLAALTRGGSEVRDERIEVRRSRSLLVIP